jgi:hypothetical protein
VAWAHGDHVMTQPVLCGRCLRVAITLAALAAAPAVRTRLLHWGATPAEVAAPLPGDDVLPDADVVATRAITIDATKADVWPWLAQLGQGRGGLYSYDALENLVGCDMRSSDVIVPEWQDVAVGDEVRLHPEVALAVVRVDPGHALVLRGAVQAGATPAPYDFTWAFVVLDAPCGQTRLVVRERYAYLRASAALLVEPVSVVSWFMSRRMLRGIKLRAEQASDVRTADSPGSAPACCSSAGRRHCPPAGRRPRRMAASRR